MTGRHRPNRAEFVAWILLLGWLMNTTKATHTATRFEIELPNGRITFGQMR